MVSRPVSCRLSIPQADFANAFIGGGVLTSGCVQEEIRFAVCPELVPSVLLCQKMAPDEAIVLIGGEQFSAPQGYAGSFKWGGAFEVRHPYWSGVGGSVVRCSLWCVLLG
jgi:hypothetical protein